MSKKMPKNSERTGDMSCLEGSSKFWRLYMAVAKKTMARVVDPVLREMANRARNKDGVK